jgi:hypothetical protein
MFRVGLRSKLLFFAVLFLAISAIVLWDLKPWIKEVWISTTPDAFVRPALPPDDGKRNNTHLVVSISPSPGPKEADEIYRSAKRGRIVHVTLVSKRNRDYFDITGVTPDGNLLVDVSSMSDVTRVTSLLKFGDRTL